MNKPLAALKLLQRTVARHFGKTSQREDCGEATVYISGSKIDMTDLNGTIVARGPVKVATVLLRRCRKTGKIKR